jgi:hypothetical protein
MHNPFRDRLSAGSLDLVGPCQHLSEPKELNARLRRLTPPAAEHIKSIAIPQQ